MHYTICYDDALLHKAFLQADVLEVNETVYTYYKAIHYFSAFKDSFVEVAYNESVLNISMLLHSYETISLILNPYFGLFCQ